MDKNNICGRCLSLKGIKKRGKMIPVTGPNGYDDYVCQNCYDEITLERGIMFLVNEDEENSGIY